MMEQQAQHKRPVAQPVLQPAADQRLRADTATRGDGMAGPGQEHLSTLSIALNAAPGAQRFAAMRHAVAQRARNATGLPDALKAGVESLSGRSMDHVRVHYNSVRPAQMNAHAYAQGSDIHLAPGQERHLPHEAWHVVQQVQGRVRPTLQLKNGLAVNDDTGLEHEADVMGSKASAGVVAGPVQPDAFSAPGGPIVQRIIMQNADDEYAPGTLRSDTRAMRGLNLQQMNTIQQLHDDPSKRYTIEQAREKATQSASSANPFLWDVNGIGGLRTSDQGVQDVLDNFGHPTQSVVKTYGDLAGRVGYDLGKSRKGALAGSTVTDLHQMFDASTPLHVGFNPFLNAAWNDNLANYNGAKTGIPLYRAMRSAFTHDFVAEDLGTASLNDVLNAVSSRPAEVHHLLYKAHYPNLATTPENLMLTERSERESVYGPGQHELMHMVSSGNHQDKFNELPPQVVQTYDDWLKARKGSGLP